MAPRKRGRHEHHVADNRAGAVHCIVTMISVTSFRRRDFSRTHVSIDGMPAVDLDQNARFTPRRFENTRLASTSDPPAH